MVECHGEWQTGQTRDEYDAPMGRVLLVLLAFHRSEQFGPTDRSSERKVLDAGRSVHWREGGCGPASALFAGLAQGVVRYRKAEDAVPVLKTCPSRHRAG